MGRGKRYQPEQVVNLLRQIEVAVANGKTTAQACKEAEIVEQTYFRWRKEYGGLQIEVQFLRLVGDRHGKIERTGSREFTASRLFRSMFRPFTLQILPDSIGRFSDAALFDQ